jgi:amino-acid N-acetyltransferase
MPPAADASPAPAPRPARAADLPAVERLRAAADLPTAGVGEILAAHPADFVVADEPGEPGELAAVAGLEVRGDGALLRSVAVRPAWRSHGVARALVSRLVDAAEGRGLHALYLLTTTAEDYFPRFGFRRVERAAVPAEIRATLEFTSACPASAVVMAKPLTTARQR